MSEMDKDVFKVLSDRHRRRIVSALCGGPMVAGELGRLVGLAPNAVSFHLKLLRSAGLVSVRRKGRFLQYEANAGVLAGWQAEVDRLFAQRVADRLAEQAVDAQQVQSSEVDISTTVEKTPTDAGEDVLPTELL